MGFGPYDCALKIRESIGTPSPQVGIHFPIVSRACGVTLGLLLGPQPCKPLCLSHEPKARVATLGTKRKLRRCWLVLLALRGTTLIGPNIFAIENSSNFNFDQNISKPSYGPSFPTIPPHVNQR
jgi:hypothetical protein